MPINLKQHLDTIRAELEIPESVSTSRSRKAIDIVMRDHVKFDQHRGFASYFSVKSQSFDEVYTVVKTRSHTTCNCPDTEKYCKHAQAVEILLFLKMAEKSFAEIERENERARRYETETLYDADLFDF